MAERTAARTVVPRGLLTRVPVAARRVSMMVAPIAVRAELSGPVTDAGAPEQGVPASVYSDSTALGQLVGPDAELFATRHWGREPLLSRAADAIGPTGLLDLDDIDELLSCRGLRAPFLRVVRDGAVVDSADFTGSGGVGAEIGDQVRDERVAALFSEGATLVLQGLHRTWSTVMDFCTELAGELAHPVQANAYVTPPQSQGFAAHYDVHDVFVMQVAGRKHWRIHTPVHTDPLRNQPWEMHRDCVTARARDDEPAIDTVLEPGDVLYLPRGWLHAATALGGVSAHLTIGVHVITRFALVEALVALLDDDERLRVSLPLGLDVADPAALAGHLDVVRETLADAVASVPVEAVAGRVRERVWTGSRPEPVRPINGSLFLHDLGPADTVRRRGGLRYRLTTVDDGLMLELADRKIQLPAVTGPALRALLGGAAQRVGRLPGLGEDDGVVLVRRLLREGVLVPATR
ncbi:hypothetical protein GCM10009836_73000 [Pseudonocardia ailaonensis]|uniref:JmjC domain-containing protein n=2 Tax=Pseudonocardia ailaonensis TaxID=367279 RepID=A0ABN2NRC6_9PSEU